MTGDTDGVLYSALDSNLQRTHCSMSSSLRFSTCKLHLMTSNFSSSICTILCWREMFSDEVLFTGTVLLLLALSPDKDIPRACGWRSFDTEVLEASFERQKPDNVGASSIISGSMSTSLWTAPEEESKESKPPSTPQMTSFERTDTIFLSQHFNSGGAGPPTVFFSSDFLLASFFLVWLCKSYHFFFTSFTVL